MDIATLRSNLVLVQERIDEMLHRAGRAGPVQIIAVTKGHSPEVVEAALALGLRRIGENRAAELEEKVATVGRDRAEWHMVGRLQRNKVRRTLPICDLIHSVDSLRLAEAVSAEALRLGQSAKVFVQVNASCEASKQGFLSAELVDVLGSISEMPALVVDGLMTMAPLNAEHGQLRRIFATMRELLLRCQHQLPGFHGTHLSMGMSNDFEAAVLEGATMVRLGTVLFGERL